MPLTQLLLSVTTVTLLDMERPPKTEPSADALAFLLALGVLLFASPLVYWWTTPDSPWYLPYLLWLLLIALGGWLLRRGRPN